MEVYTEISEDMVEIFVSAYRDYPPAQAEFGEMSIPDLREMAGKQAIAARNFDPHKKVHDAQNFLSGFYRIVEFVLGLAIVVGILSGASYVVISSRGVLQTLNEYLQILVILLLGSTSVISLLAGLVLLYIRLLSFNTFVVQTLNRELAMGMDEITTRDEEWLVGCIIWNSSLNGGRGLELLAIFSVLWILSAIPRWEPYTFVTDAIKNNIDIFAESDGVIDATRRTFNRFRSK